MYSNMEDEKKPEKKDSVVKTVKKTVSELVSSIERKSSEQHNPSGKSKKNKKNSTATSNGSATKEEPIYDIPPMESSKTIINGNTVEISSTSGYKSNGHAKMVNGSSSNGHAVGNGSVSNGNVVSNGSATTDYTISNGSATTGYTISNGSVTTGYTDVNGSVSNGYAIGNGSASNGYAIGNGSASNGYAIGNGTTYNGHVVMNGSASNGHVVMNGSASNGHVVANGSASGGYPVANGSSSNGYAIGSGAVLSQSTVSKTSESYSVTKTSSSSPLYDSVSKSRVRRPSIPEPRRPSITDTRRPSISENVLIRDAPYVSKVSHVIYDSVASTPSTHSYTKTFDVKNAVGNTSIHPSKSGGIERYDYPYAERVSWQSEPDLGIWADFKPSVWSGRVLKMVTEMGSATIGGISPALSANAAKSFLEATDKEKKELQGLNDRLGNYIDRVKRLEEQNRKLVADLDELRGKWGKDTSEIKIKYSESLSTARKDIDDAARRKAEIDVKVARLRDDLAEYRSRYEDIQHRREGDREKINQWTNAIADAQAELEMLRARWKQLTEEEKRLNADNVRIWEELQKARNDLDEETIGRIDFQNQVQTLMEELEFLRRVHEQEVKELQALLAQAPADTREFFKNELALAIRDIKDEYDYIAKQGKQDMESWYKLKVSEVQGSANRAAVESNYQREEVKRMRDNISDLRGKLGDLENKNSLLEKEVQNLNYQLQDDQRQYEAALNDRDSTLRRMREECQTLVAELQALLDTKQMLDAEIAIYRKMLEGEESRVGLRQMVEQVVKTHSLQQQEDTDSTRSVRGEVSTKTTFQRSAKGNVTIAECDPNGKFITLENTHRTKDENLGEHKLKRKLDGNRREIVYTIPAGTVLKAGKSMKIYARDQGGIHNPPESLVFDAENTWGIGANVVTSLYNKEGEERATHTQKTIQTGQ